MASDRSTPSNCSARSVSSSDGDYHPASNASATTHDGSTPGQ